MLLALLSGPALACGASVPTPSPAPAPSSYQPCLLEAAALELPVGEHFALAVSEGACLLIDESREASFISIAELRDDEEGFSLLQEDLRAFLRASAILGDSPLFTGREHADVLDQHVEVHTFVATPSGLPERTGFALRVSVPGGAVLFIGLSDTPSEAAALERWVSGARLQASAISPNQAR